MSELPVYRVSARNTAPDSENKMHDDRVAAEFGFRGGLVPGVTVYAYMTVPVVESLGLDWLERGSMKVRFIQPFFDGDQVLVRSEQSSEGGFTVVKVRAERETGELCASGEASLSNEPRTLLPSPIADDSLPPGTPLPPADDRLPATLDALKPGTVFGSLSEAFDLELIASTLLRKIDECLPIYYGPSAIAHPITLLTLSNYMLMQNVKLGPWIHASSDLVNYSVVRDGEMVTVNGRIHDTFERKGHEFVVLDLVVSSSDRLVQKVRHTAIFNPRKP